MLQATQALRAGHHDAGNAAVLPASVATRMIF